MPTTTPSLLARCAQRLRSRIRADSESMDLGRRSHSFIKGDRLFAGTIDVVVQSWGLGLPRSFKEIGRSPTMPPVPIAPC